MVFKVGGFISLCLFLACANSTIQSDTDVQLNAQNLMNYAQMVSVYKEKDSFIIQVKNNSGQLFATYKLPQKLPQKPSIVALSSVFVGFITAINQDDCIVAVDDIRYIHHPHILKQHELQRIVSIGSEGGLNYEKLLELKPDFVIYAGTSDAQFGVIDRMEKAGMKFVLCNNYLENSPLGRAEWIKVFGIICGRYEEADALFKLVESNYVTLKKEIAEQVVKKPTVLVGSMYGGVWDVPARNSYTAQLLLDAGTDLIWSDDSPTNRFPLSLEQVVSKALQAPFWINVGQFTSLNDLVNADNRYRFFEAYKSQNIYNNNKQVNAFGGNAFWESGPVRPDWVLKDLQIIFHVKNSHSDSLRYYRQLN